MCGAGAVGRETAGNDSDDFSARRCFANAYERPGARASWLRGRSLLTAGFRDAEGQASRSEKAAEGSFLPLPVPPSPVGSRSPLSRSPDNRRRFASFSRSSARGFPSLDPWVDIYLCFRHR